MVFIDLFSGYPGSSHDAKVFANSGIAHQISSNSAEMCPNGSYILGDSAYPLSPNLLTPYKDFGEFSPVQRRYNYVQSSTRVIIERAFGLLKGKFRRLKKIELNTLKTINNLIHACVILHNFCIFSKEDNSFVEIDEEEEDDDDADEEEDGVLAVGSKMEDYKRYRDMIAEDLYFEY